MSFVMPSKYDLHSLPRPNNPDVHIVQVRAACTCLLCLVRPMASVHWRHCCTRAQVPSHLAAALTFRGHIRGRQLVERKAQELRALLEVRHACSAAAAAEAPGPDPEALRSRRSLLHSAVCRPKV